MLECRKGANGVNAFYCILLRKRPSCRFMHSLCKNENTSMWGKHCCRITKEIAIHLNRIIN